MKQKITSLVLDFPDGGERYGVKAEGSVHQEGKG